MRAEITFLGLPMVAHYTYIDPSPDPHGLDCYEIQSLQVNGMPLDLDGLDRGQYQDVLEKCIQYTKDTQ